MCNECFVSQQTFCSASLIAAGNFEGQAERPTLPASNKCKHVRKNVAIMSDGDPGVDFYPVAQAWTFIFENLIVQRRKYTG